MNALRALPRRLLAALAAMVFLLAWVGIGYLTRRVAIAAELQYVSPHYEYLITTGSPRRLWAAIDEHFGALIRNDPYKGGVYTAFRDLRAQLEDMNLKIMSPEDIDASGLDSTRGAIVAFYESLRYLVVLNATDVGQLSRTLVRATGGDADNVSGLSVTPVEIGEFFLANPAGRIVVLSNDKSLLETALSGTSENRRYAFASDALYESISEQLGSPMLTGASFLLSTGRSVHPLLRRLSAVVTLNREITVDASVDLEVAPVRVLDALVAAPPKFILWANELPETTAAVATLRDWQIPLYVDALARAGLLTSVQERYAGVLGELRNLPSLRQVTLAASGYHDGLPDLLFGLWAEPASVDAMITRIQSRIRVRRDQAILKAALAAGQSPSQENGGLFDRYRIANGVVEPVTLTAQDFANDSYERGVGGQTIRFLLPPITSNDISYRPELQRVTDQARLKSDRYRLAVARVGDVYWFATDAGLLEARLRQGAARASLQDLDLFESAQQRWTGGERAQIFANLDRVIDAGLLSPETTISEAIRKYVFDLREHPAVSISVATSSRPARARVVVKISQQ